MFVIICLMIIIGHQIKVVVTQVKSIEFEYSPSQFWYILRTMRRRTTIKCLQYKVFTNIMTPWFFLYIIGFIVRQYEYSDAARNALGYINDDSLIWNYCHLHNLNTQTALV